MQSKIILISDDSDFFEYIVSKLKLRKSDELFRFAFSDLPDKLHLLSSSLLIINSEGHQEQTLQLLDFINDIPTVVFGYNNDDEFVFETYKKGAFLFLTLAASDEEIEAKLIPALKLVTTYEKTALYRDMLVNNKLITKNNEVFLDFTNLLESEIKKIKKNASVATLIAISPDEKSKFTVQPNQLETVILNNIRKNDILMSYSFNKYFLLLNNTNKDKAGIIWENIKSKLPDGVYAGFASVGNKSRQQLVNEVLNNLHRKMSSDLSFIDAEGKRNSNNFKSYRKEFDKKIQQIVSPVFYHIQQTYSNKLFGITIEQGSGDGYGILYLKSEKYIATLKITNPGLSSVNIDISYNNTDNSNENLLNLTNKRISLEPEELESGLLNDLIEQFISEFKEAVSE